MIYIGLEGPALREAEVSDWNGRCHTPPPASNKPGEIVKIKQLKQYEDIYSQVFWAEHLVINLSRTFAHNFYIYGAVQLFMKYEYFKNQANPWALHIFKYNYYIIVL